jgi:hypothetical protein
MAQSTIDTLIQVGGVAITLVAGFVTWFLNERSKRSEEQYRRKEERYVELVKALRGFYVDSFDKLTNFFRWFTPTKNNQTLRKKRLLENLYLPFARIC